jgi:hypothetical protein
MRILENHFTRAHGYLALGFLLVFSSFTLFLVCHPNALYGRVWRGYMLISMELLANVDREPETGLVGLPLVKTKHVRAAQVEVDPKGESVRFRLGDKMVLFDGSRFRFVETGSTN